MTELNLYNPLTGESIANYSIPEQISLINKNCSRSRLELNKLLNASKSSLDPIDFSKTSKWEFIVDYISKEPDVQNILSRQATSNTNTARNQLYEDLWDIIVKFNLIDILQNKSDISHYSGKIDKGDFPTTKIKDMKEYFKRDDLTTSCKGGVSDISFSIGNTSNHDKYACESDNQGNGESGSIYYITSVKYYNKVKSVAGYDIQDLFTAKDSKDSYLKDKSVEIIVITNNSDKFKDKISNATRKYISDNATHILGSDDDLEYYYTKLHTIVKHYMDTHNDSLETYFDENKNKVPKIIIPKLHQELIVNQIINKLQDNQNKFIIGAVARSGKTYIVALLILKLIKLIAKRQPNNLINPETILIITPYPTETLNQWYSVFKEFQGFDNFSIITSKNSKLPSDRWDSKHLKSKRIYIYSKQTLEKKGKPNNELNDISVRMQLPGSYIFFDEAHQGGITDISKTMIDKFSSVNTILTYLSATYLKILGSPDANVDKNNCFIWSYDNIQLAKRLNEEDARDKLIDEFGDSFETSINNLETEYKITPKMIQNDYQKYPDLYVLTSILDKDTLESMLGQQKHDEDGTFNMSILMSVVDDGSFRYKDNVNAILNYLQPIPKGSKQEKGYEKNNLEDPAIGIFPRISNISKVIKSRTYPNCIKGGFKPNTQLWFLPQATTDTGNTESINSFNIQYAMAKLIKEHPILQTKYDILVVSGSNKNLGAIDGVKKYDNNTNIKQYEKTCYQKNRGLIILSIKMLTTGITLPCVDIVVLLDNLESSDLNFQRMFRCLTQSKNKKAGFVVDLNPKRVIKTLYKYGIKKTGIKTPKQITRELLELFYIDRDILFKGNVRKGPPIDYNDVKVNNENYIAEDFDNFLAYSRNALDNELDKFKDILEPVFANLNMNSKLLIEKTERKEIEHIHQKNKNPTLQGKASKAVPSEFEKELAGTGNESDEEKEESDDREEEKEEEVSDGKDDDVNEDQTEQKQKWKNIQSFIKDFITYFVILHICNDNFDISELIKQLENDDDDDKKHYNFIIISLLDNLIKETKESKTKRFNILRMALLRNKLLPNDWTISKLDGKDVFTDESGRDSCNTINDVFDRIGKNTEEYESKNYPNFMTNFIYGVKNEKIIDIILDEIRNELLIFAKLKQNDKKEYLIKMKEYLPTTSESKKSTGDIFTPLTLIDGDFNETVSCDSDEEGKDSDEEGKESDDDESYSVEPKDDKLSSSDIKRKISQDVVKHITSKATQNILNSYDSNARQPEGKATPREGKGTPSDSNYCYRKPGRQGVYKIGEFKGSPKPGWTCNSTDSESANESEYCTFDTTYNECRPNCYFEDDGNRRVCKPVKKDSFPDDKIRCRYNNIGNCVMTSNREKEKLKKIHQGGSLKHYYNENLNNIKNTY